MSGKVTDEANGQPLVGARVQATTQQVFAITNQQGQYTIRGMTPGLHTIRVFMLGYASQTKSLTVGPNGVGTLDWTLKAVPFQLEEIVTTATGEQATRELGNTVGKIQVTHLVETAPTTNLVQKKYPSIDSPVEMATGIEARLIEAEAAYQAGSLGLWLQKLNDARATVAALTPLTDPGTANGRVDLTFRERAFWMYLTAHRLGDLRRLARPAGGGLSGYGRGVESVYPTGAYHKQGLTRGLQATLIVPQPEENNSNYTPANCTVTVP